MLLVSLPLSSLSLLSLHIQSKTYIIISVTTHYHSAKERLTKMLRNLFILNRRKNLRHPRRAHIDEHISIRESLDSTLERRFSTRMRRSVDQSFSTVILFEDFSIRYRNDAIVVEA